MKYGSAVKSLRSGGSEQLPDHSLTRDAYKNGQLQGREGFCTACQKAVIIIGGLREAEAGIEDNILGSELPESVYLAHEVVKNGRLHIGEVSRLVVHPFNAPL